MNPKDLDLLLEMFTDSKGKLNPAKRQTEMNKAIALTVVEKQTEFLSVTELLWSIKNSILKRPVCPGCGKQLTFDSFKYGFFKNCSKICAANSLETKQKTKNSLSIKYGGHHTSNLEFRKMLKDKYKIWPGSFSSPEYKAAILDKYGVENVFQSQEIKDKIKQTLLDRYGVDNPLKSQKIKDSVSTTQMLRYGQKRWNPSKAKETLLQKYGVDNPQKSKIIQAKTKITNIKKYGVEYPMQNVDIHLKCMKARLSGSYNVKSLTLPSGKIVFYQGYEGYVINYHLLEIDEDDLMLERDVPTIRYKHLNRSRTYYPDIFVKSRNLLIEVKSTYTFDKQIELNLAKQQAAKDCGYNHVIIIWDVKTCSIAQTI